MMLRSRLRKLVVSGPFIRIRNTVERRFGRLMYEENKFSFLPVDIS